MPPSWRTRNARLPAASERHRGGAKGIAGEYRGAAAAVEQHLEDHGQFPGRGKQSGIAGHAAEDGCRFVMHIAVHQLVTPALILNPTQP